MRYVRAAAVIVLGALLFVGLALMVAGLTLIYFPPSGGPIHL